MSTPAALMGRLERVSIISTAYGGIPSAPGATAATCISLLVGSRACAVSAGGWRRLICVRLLLLAAQTAQPGRAAQQSSPAEQRGGAALKA